VLINEQDGNVLALAREAIKGSFDGRGLSLAVYDQEVLLAVWGLGNMLYHSSVFCPIAISGESKSIRLRQRATCPCKCPASSQSASVDTAALKSTRYTHLVADDGEELSVLVLRCRCCHGGMCSKGSCRREVGAWLGELHAARCTPSSWCPSPRSAKCLDSQLLSPSSFHPNPQHHVLTFHAALSFF
jgi:hypothetical protein